MLLIGGYSVCVMTDGFDVLRQEVEWRVQAAGRVRAGPWDFPPYVPRERVQYLLREINKDVVERTKERLAIPLATCGDLLVNRQRDLSATRRAFAQT